MTEKEVYKMVYTILNRVFTYAERNTDSRTFVDEAFELLEEYTSDELDEIKYQEQCLTKTGSNSHGDYSTSQGIEGENNDR